MSQDNVVQHQTAVWKNLKEWCDKEQKHVAEARDCWPHIAAGMARLRRDYASDKEFGAALVMHEIEYNKNDRAAFIWMGTINPEALEDAMARCERRSAQHFRQEVESWSDPYFASVSSREETVSDGNGHSETAETEPMTRELATRDHTEELETQNADYVPTPDPIAAAVTAKTVTAKIKPDQRTVRKLDRFDDSDLLYAMLPGRGNNARRTFSKMADKKKYDAFIRFLIDQIKLKRIAPKPINAHRLHAGHFINNLHQSFGERMQFVDASSRLYPEAMKQFMDHFDALLEAADKGLTWAEFQNTTVNARTPKVIAPVTMPSREIVLPDGTVLKPEPILVCGEMLYPRDMFAKLPYQHAYVFAHLCRELAMGELRNQSVDATGMTFAHMGKKISRFAPDLDVIGTFINQIGTGIKARGKGIDRHLWFKLEPLATKYA